MFFLKKKEDSKDSGIKAFCHAAEELRQGKQIYLPVLYQALVAEDKETIRFVAREIAQYMQSLNAGQIIRLSHTGAALNRAPVCLLPYRWRQ